MACAKAITWCKTVFSPLKLDRVVVDFYCGKHNMAKLVK
jgi:hypothetical protein